jgi:F-type H+-transporting ATPase subunit b
MTSVTLAAGNSNFLVPNSTILVEFVIFGLVIFIFSRFIVPPLAKSMRERDALLKKGADDRTEAGRRLEQAKERYDSSLAEARAESTKIKDEARAEAEKTRQEMRSETEQEIAAVKEEGARQLAEQRAAATETLHGEIGGLSTQLAGRILGKPIGADGPHKATVEQFLADLRGKQSGDKQTTGGKS